MIPGTGQAINKAVKGLVQYIVLPFMPNDTVIMYKRHPLDSLRDLTAKYICFAY